LSDSNARALTPVQAVAARLTTWVVGGASICKVVVVAVWATHYPAPPDATSTGLAITNYQALQSADNATVIDIFKAAAPVIVPTLTFFAGRLFNVKPKPDD
jgi:hypothetical protein